MSLTLKMCCIPAPDCKSIYVFDQTGVYNVSSNPTGYGAPNPATGDFASATLSVLYAGATVPVIINVFPTLPVSNTQQAYLLNVAAVIPTATIFPTGITRITYTLVTKTNVTYTATSEFAMDCSLQCCISGRLQAQASRFVAGNCDCDDDELCDAIFLDSILDAAEAATCCGNVTEANNMFDWINTKCNSSSDGGCGCS